MVKGNRLDFQNEGPGLDNNWATTLLSDSSELYKKRPWLTLVSKYAKYDDCIIDWGGGLETPFREYTEKDIPEVA